MSAEARAYIHGRQMVTFDWSAWRTTFTSTFRGHRIEGQVRRDELDEIEGRILIDGRVLLMDCLPDLSTMPVYLPLEGGFILAN